MNLEELRELRAQLESDPGSVSDEQIKSAIDAIRRRVAQAREEDPTPELVSELEALREIRDTVVAERDARVERAAADAEKARELIEGLDIPEPEQAGEPEEQAVEEPAAETPVEPVAETGESVEETEVTEDTREPVLAASAVADLISQSLEKVLSRFSPAPAAVSEDGKPAGRTARPAKVDAPAPQRDEVAVAKVYVGSHSAHGAEITSNLDIAKAIYDTWRGDYQARRGRFPVLTVQTSYPESRILTNDAESNFRKIDAVTSPGALVAAGGLCAPLETVYDVEVVGSTERPIRDALARFAVDRGGIQFRSNLSAASAVGAGAWTVEDDAAVDNESDPVLKQCWPVECPAVEEAVVQAIYTCLEFGNISARFDPESTAANVRQGLIAHARVAERELYRQMTSSAKVVTGNPQQVGATRHVLGEIDKLVAYLRDRHREPNISLVWVAPHWLRDLMRADIAYQLAAGDWAEALGVSQQMIDGWFARRNVRPVWYLDGAAAQQTVNGVVIPPQVYGNVAAGSAIPDFPPAADTLLFFSGDYLFLDGGSLDLGLVRDSDLNAKNRYRQFSETFEGVAFRGVESLRPVIEVCPTGATSGATEVSCVES